MKILINGITLDNANIVPLLTNVLYYQRKGAEITVLGSSLLKKRITEANIINSFSFIEIKGSKKISSNLDLIVEGLKRNFQAALRIKNIKDNFDVIYCRSSVLDLLIFPYILKSFDKKVKWAAVFDNTVTWKQTSKVLAWIFYQISLILLKKTNTIFAVSEELKKYLVNKGFHERKITVTGNAVEASLIRRAVVTLGYKVDALFLGRINRLKGVYDMLAVLKRVIKKYPDFQLGIVGKGDKTSEVEFRDKVKKMNLEKNVIFFGYVSGQRKFNIIKSSKVFWFLSRSESFGLALLEAVASGKPALVYGLDTYDAIYTDEIFRFKRGDTYGIAEKTIDIFEREEFENSKGKLLLGKYGSWKRIAEIEYTALTKNTF